MTADVMERARTLFIEAMAEQESGRLAAAETRLRQAHALLPERESIASNLAAVLLAQGLHEEALGVAASVLQRNPQAVEALLNAGLAAQRLERYTPALQYFQRLLDLAPDHLAARLGAAACECARQEHARALAHAGQATETDPACAEAWWLQGVALAGLLRHESALAAHRRATELNPALSGAWLGAGNAADELGEPGLAQECYEHALALAPQLHEAAHNLGNALAATGEFARALACYEEALRLRPAAPLSVLNRGIAHLALGNFAQGFADYEARPLRAPEPASGTAPWRGEDLRGRSLFVHAEQGFGDILLFARFVPRLVELGAQVLLGVPAELGSLMRSLGAGIKVLTSKQQVAPHDYHCALASLPFLLGVRTAAGLGGAPYLAVPPANRERWAAQPGRRRPRIGLVWHGSVGSAAGGHFGRRALPLAALAPLAALDADFLSLQKECAPEDRASWATMPWLEDLSLRLGDFADTAAAIGQLDLLVSVDTAVPALAGALGKPVWVLLAQAADWRWMAAGERTPWFASARLMRQTQRGDWHGLIRDQLMPALERFVRQHRADSEG